MYSAVQWKESSCCDFWLQNYLPENLFFFLGSKEPISSFRVAKSTEICSQNWVKSERKQLLHISFSTPSRINHVTAKDKYAISPYFQVCRIMYHLEKRD